MAGRSGGRFDSSVEGGPSHAKSGGNLGNGDISRFEQCADGLYLFGGEFGRATSVATAGARRLETGYRPFADQVALELRQGCENVEYQPAGGGDGLNLFGERFEIDLLLFELSDEGYEIGKIPPQPIKLPYDNGVALTQTFQAGLQLRPLGVFTGGVFFINLPTLGPLQSVPLQIQGLVFGRDTSVADAHGLNVNKSRYFGHSFPDGL